MNEFDPVAEAEELIEKFLSQEIEPEEGERLLEFLRANEDWEKKLYDQYHIVSLLKEIRDGASHQEEVESELMGELVVFYEKVSLYSQAMRRRSFRRQIIASCCFLFSIFALAAVTQAYWSGYLGVTRTKYSLQMPPGATTDAVAVLSHAIDVEWTSDSEVRAQTGSNLVPGLYSLQKGVAIIQLYNGAAITVEAPCQFRIESISRIECSSGRFSLDMPDTSANLLVDTPFWRSISGGSYYLCVDETEAELHCFAGTLHTQFSKTQEASILKPGQAVKTTVEGVNQTITFKNDAYLSSERFFALAKRKAEEQFAKWSTSRSRLADDPSLLIFFDFQKCVDTPIFRVRNQANAKSSAPLDGVLIGGRRSAGRWPAKDSLEFRTVSDRLLVSIPEPLTNLTLSVSLRADEIDRNLNSIFLTEDFIDGPLHWQILNNVKDGTHGAIRLGIHEPKPDNFKATNFDSPVVFVNEQMGVWVRLAVVLDAEKQTVTHYKDGKVLSRHDVPFEMKFSLSRAEIGNWTSPTPINPIRNFVGGFEEFLLFSRALSEEEIEKLHALE